MRPVSSPQRPNAWTNQDILLYHETANRSALDTLDRIGLNKCRPAFDFGLGFYIATLLRQADAWAQLKAYQSREPPGVVEFVVKGTFWQRWTGYGLSEELTMPQIIGA